MHHEFYKNDEQKKQQWKASDYGLPISNFGLPTSDLSSTMRRVAIPITNNQLSEYFGGCHHYEIFEIEKGVTGKQSASLPEGIVLEELPNWLQKQGITDVIAYKVNREIISLFASKKLNLFIGIPINTPENLIEDYLNGTLTSDKNIIAELTTKEIY